MFEEFWNSHILILIDNFLFIFNKYYLCELGRGSTCRTGGYSKEKNNERKDRWKRGERKVKGSCCFLSLKKNKHFYNICWIISSLIYSSTHKREEKLREKELRNKKLTPEELLADRLERQKLQQESDLRLAIEAFGGGDSNPRSANLDLDEHTLASKEDFEKFRLNLTNKLAAVSSVPFYASFLEDLFRDLCVPIDIDDLKKISSSLTALYNEKLKAQRVNRFFRIFSFQTFNSLIRTV